MDLLELIKLHEGFSRTVYRCTANKQTIGHGRNLDDVGISRVEAEFLLKNDIDRAKACLVNEPYWAKLDDVRQAVLIDMVFNLGWAGFSAFVRMRDALCKSDFTMAAAEMMASRWAAQVGRRARRLSDMMRTGNWQ